MELKMNHFGENTILLIFHFMFDIPLATINEEIARFRDQFIRPYLLGLHTLCYSDFCQGLHANDIKVNDKTSIGLNAGRFSP